MRDTEGSNPVVYPWNIGLGIVSHIGKLLLKLPRNLDADGKITEYIIYTIKDLRNAVAHNNTIFDTRFQTNSINRRLLSLLETEIGTNGLDFKYIEAYVILITYVLRKMGVTKTECKQFINSFADCTNELRVQMNPNVCNQILGTQQISPLIILISCGSSSRLVNTHFEISSTSKSTSKSIRKIKLFSSTIPANMRLFPLPTGLA